MYREMVFLLWSAVAMAQEAIDAAFQAYSTAHQEGRFLEAAAKREDARKLLDRASVDRPEFPYRVENVARLYANAGKNAQARVILQEALARADALGESHPTRIVLLSALADFWQNDRNLLKSLAYREKAASAVDAASGGSQDYSQVYLRLAELYQRLGRPKEAAAVLEKMRERAGGNEAALASFYEQHGQLDEAVAIYQKQVERAAANSAAEPGQLIGSLESLANLYQRQQRYADAAAALQRLIVAVDATGTQQNRRGAILSRQKLARVYQAAGQTEAAGQIYEQLLIEMPNDIEVLTEYANFLGEAKRGVQAEQLLNDYLANHPSLEPWQESGVLSSLSNVARLSGQEKRADEYERAAAEKLAAAMHPDSLEVNRIGEHVSKALAAANEDRLDEAFNLALQAMGTAPMAVDRALLASAIPEIATALAGKKAADKAEQLYHRLFSTLESWSADTVQPLLTALQSYPRSLMQQPDRWVEVPRAIDRYRDAMVAAHGEGTGLLEEVLRLRIEFERTHGSPVATLHAAEDLLALEELLSGTTTEPYMRALEALADVYQSSGDSGRSTEFLRQAVAIADLVFPASDPRRVNIRLKATRWTNPPAAK